MSQFRPPGPCPVCGEDVPPRARACPKCGASHDSGWNEEARYDGLNLPDDTDFDYDEYLEREFGTSSSNPQRSSARQRSQRKRRNNTLLALVALVLAMLLLGGGWILRWFQ